MKKQITIDNLQEMITEAVQKVYEGEYPYDDGLWDYQGTGSEESKARVAKMRFKRPVSPETREKAVKENGRRYGDLSTEIYRLMGSLNDLKSDYPEVRNLVDDAVDKLTTLGEYLDSAMNKMRAIRKWAKA